MDIPSRAVIAHHSGLGYLAYTDPYPICCGATWVEYCIERVLMNDERSKDCYDHYYAWCRENGHIRPVTHTMFGKRLDALGLKRHRTSKGIFYRDLRLLVE